MTLGMDEECQFHSADTVLQIKLLQEAVDRSDDEGFALAWNSCSWIWINWSRPSLKPAAQA